MAHTNRYKGLLFLKENQFPVPDFFKIELVEQLSDSFFETIAPYGWTVRTCKKNGENEFSLFYKNYISKEELLSVIKARLVEYNDEFYIAYHSWEFEFSFNVVKTEYNYIIEGKFGSQKNISLGIETSFISMDYNSINRRLSSKDINLINKQLKARILDALEYLEYLNYHDRIYSEVAITKKGQLYFYEFWDLNNI